MSETWMFLIGLLFAPFELVLAFGLCLGVPSRCIFSKSAMRHFKRDGYIHFEFIPWRFALKNP